MSATTELVQMIERFIEGDWSFQDFNQRYYNHYVRLPEEPGTTADEERFFSDVHEWLDWTTENPSPADRSDGWHDVEQFKVWLRGAFREQFRS